MSSGDEAVAILQVAIMGEGTLPIRCGEILLRHGHRISLVISPDPEVLRWARAGDMEAMTPVGDIADEIRRREIDYLFSIVNYRVLKKDVLTAPRIATINYHDGPLPRYGGLHATTWAILNGESRHGVTWHEAVEMVDGGDIFVRGEVPVEPRDTALSLNLRCHDVAVGAFEKLVTQLERGRGSPTAQNLSRREYHSIRDRPEGAAILDWRKPAEELDALVRALDFGPYRNTIGVPKLDLGTDVLLVVSGRSTMSASTAAPGTIVSAGADRIIVSTATTDFEIREVGRLTGGPVALDRLAADHELRPGRALPILDAVARRRISAVDAELAARESYWLNRLLALRPVDLPRVSPGRPTGERYDAVAFDTRPFVDDLPDSVDGAAFILACFIGYLSRLSGAESFDISFRDHSVRERLSLPRQLVAEWVPLPATVDPAAPFEMLVRATAEGVAKSRHNGSYEHDMLARYPRLANVRPAHAVTVAFVDEADTGPDPAPGCVLQLEVGSEGRSARWRFDPTAFTADVIERMSSEWRTLLESARSSFATPTGDLEIVPDEQASLLLDVWNRTAREYPRVPVTELFTRQVDRTPDRVAIACEGRTITFAELDRRANRVAHFLRDLAVQPDDRIGVCVDRSLDMHVAIMGVLKAGAAYVPLDPLYPAERLAFMVRDAECRLVLTQQALLKELPEECGPFVCLDAEPSPFERFPEFRPDFPLDPESLAYVIYTSGSTGEPKGVMVPHRALVNFLISCEREPGLGPDDVFVSVTTMSFDMSITEIFLPLVTGARLELVPRSIGDDGAALARRLAQADATFFQATPATYRLLFEARWSGAPGLRAIVGGEPVPRDLANMLLDRISEVWNGYGPTETTVWSTFGKVVSREGPVYVGRPLANTRLYVVDARRRPVPLGCTGELLIGGDGVTRGYLNHPELTAERFLDLTVGNTTDRVYATGDMVRYASDGRLECLGRIDNQVKIRGFRVELGEIETVLERNDLVKQAVVVAPEDSPGDRRLAAYVIANDAGTDRDALIAALRDDVRRTLPAHMMPSAFVVLQEFPLTRNGKVDRRALPRPEAQAVIREAADQPQTDLEKTLAAIWSEALGLEGVGRNDDFFELGGHSLILQRVRTLIEERTGRELSTRQAYQYRTVARIAAFLEGGTPDDSVPDITPSSGRTSSSPVRRFIQRFLLPGFAIALYYALRYRAKVSPRAEVELSPMLTFGRGCTVGSFTKIKATEGPIRFGERCGVANSCFITAGERGVLIGDNFACGPNVSIVSSSYVYDSPGVHVQDQGHLSLGIRIGNNVWLGASVTVLDGAELGDDTIVVAGSVVEGKHPRGVILRGNPAQVIATR